MKTPQEVYEEIISSHHELERIPVSLHLFCPRISDDDVEDYDDPAGSAVLSAEEKKQRIEDGNKRLQLTSWASLILGISRDQADRWLPDWIRRTESFLVKCDDCVRAWHMGRKSLRARLLKEFDEETTNIMEGRLHEYDTNRIDRGLRIAVQVLETHGPMTSAKLIKHDASAVLAFYEALCCIEYLSQPEKRQLFNYVFQKTQEKKPLKVASTVIPAMTVFLFQADPLRNRFARTAWERLLPQSLTSDQFDWAVSSYLADAIGSASQADADDASVELFWSGFLLLLRAMGEKIVLHCLRGMQIPQDVYQMAIQHMDRSSPQILALVLRALSDLMDKSSAAFWDAFALMNPPQLPMFVFRSPAFPAFLAASFEENMQVRPEGLPRSGAEPGPGTEATPVLVAFSRSLMLSLKRNQRPDVCDYMLSVFLNNSAKSVVTVTREGYSTCIVAGLTTLQLTIDGYLEPNFRLTAESALFVNGVINGVVNYQDYLVRSIHLHARDRYNIGLSQTALRVIESALALDTRALRDEWRSLQQQSKDTEDAGCAPRLSKRRSAPLWDGFRPALSPTNLDLQHIVLGALLSLRGVQRFSPKKRQLQVDDAARRHFNAELELAVEAMSATMVRISEFPREGLRSLCSDTQGHTMDAIVTTLMHAEDSLREAGYLLIGAVVDEDARSDAVAKMVAEFPVLFLDAFAGALRHLTGSSGDAATPFEPMRHIYRCSKDILNGLCDPATGLLRSRTLTDDERKAVKRWWTMEWQFVDHSFLRARAWNNDFEKALMENYCRDVMEFAEQLMDQDGLVASALEGSGSSSDAGSASPPPIMQDILDVPRRYSMGFFEMIQLRDLYLLGIIVRILVKLFNRLKAFNMTFPDKFVEAIRSIYTPHPQLRGKFKVNSNLDATQRAELMKAIGDGSEEDDAEVQVISIGQAASRPGAAAAKKKQTTIEAWSRSSGGAVSVSSSGASTPKPPPLSSSDMASHLAPSLEKHRGLLDSLKAHAAKKAELSGKALIAQRNAIRESRARDKAEMEKHKAEAIAKAQALRAGLKSDIMVDSASDEDDDGEDGNEGRDGAAGALMQRSKTAEQHLSETERRQQLAMQKMMARGPVKKVKLQRSAKDMRARIIPPMEKLHQAILEWDIFHEGNDPPNGYACTAVADGYASPADYRKTFFPLLINEAWRSFVTDKNETTAKAFGIKVVTRMSVDNFLEVTAVMPATANKDRDRDRMVGEGDIVLISQAQDPLTGRDQPHCLARVWKTTYKRDNVEVTYRLSSRKNQILPVLLPAAEFYVVKITNMTTIEREFAALESLQYYDLMEEVLGASPSPMLSFGDQAVAATERTYGLNRGQALAILNAKENDGFTLVQGPPGTGKTKTIVAMVGALLTGTLGKSGAAAAGAVAVHANRGGGGDSTVKKLLICAPSNAAVDELVLRLKQGIVETTGAARKINVIRLGRTDVINSDVKDVTLDEMVKAEMARQTQAPGSRDGDKKDGKKDDKNGGGDMSDREKMHQRAGEIKAKLQELMPALEAARMGSEKEDHEVTNRLQREYDTLRSEQRRIGAQIERDKESGNTYAREAEIKRRQIQQKLLNEAHVLCATLSGSGHELFKNLNVEFETVIIDEAAQCVELSALIPLKYGCAKCILVGDPKQLPPTVLSQSAARYGYDQSLFVRMQRNQPQDVHLLDTQYRMHPEISLFPSRQFYEGRLVDGGDMAQLRRQPWHRSPLLGPYRFFDVEGVQERGHKGQSLVNENEVRVAMQLYQRFRTDYGQKMEEDGGSGKKIGIITPYKAQLYALRQRFASQYGEDIAGEIEFNTTDAFQGRECEIIIFSCVRASPTGGIGFMTDIRRMNVGLTRARSSLWILGDSRALRQGEFWRALIEDAKERNRYTGGNVLGLLRAPSAAAAAPTKPASSFKTEGGGGGGGRDAGPPNGRGQRQLLAPAGRMDVDDDSYSPPPAASPPRPTSLPSHARRQPLPSPTDTGTGGINERGEALPAGPRLMGRPVVQSSAAMASASKKRPLDGGDIQPSKRPDFTLPPKPARRPTDPSAMEVLGMTNPQPSPQIKVPPTGAPTGPRQPVRPPLRLPKKKAPVDPFIKKKPNNRPK